MRVKLLFLILAFIGFYSNASVIIDGTRVIYNQNEQELIIKLTNNGKVASLVQSWIDDGDVYGKPENMDVPFILTPPINRINPKNSQTLIARYTYGSLPNDRESIFWLNVLDIPQTKAAPTDNFLKMAFRTRIKFFYRPSGLQGNPIDAAESILWTKDNAGFVAKNNSPFFVSLVSIDYFSDDEAISLEGEMIDPFSTRSFPFKSKSSAQPIQISYSYVNDWGAVKLIKTNVK